MAKLTGTRIRKIREKLGLTIQGLADHLGYSWHSVQGWEVGRTEIEHEPCIRLALCALCLKLRPRRPMDTDLILENAYFLENNTKSFIRPLEGPW